MLKVLAVGLVVVLATVLGSFVGLSRDRLSSKQESSPPEDSFELVKLEPISVPIIGVGKVTGYVVARVAFAAAANKVKSEKATLISFVTEAVFRSFFNDNKGRFADFKRVPIEELSSQVVSDANAKIGRPVIANLIIENLQFVPREEVRCGDQQ